MKEWYASPQLQRIFEERMAAKGITQKQFGKESGIGSQPMVHYLLERKRTITVEQAVNFAKALRCTIYEVCPEMADFLTKEVVPVLGKALRRAAVFAAVCIGLLTTGAFDNKTFAASAFDKSLNTLHIVIDWFLTFIARLSRTPYSAA